MDKPQKSDDEVEIVNSLSVHGLKGHKDREENVSTLLETKPIKYITYGTVKKFRKWSSAARMSDSPRVNPKSTYKSKTLEGGQFFEIVIYYEPKDQIPIIIGTVKWGWEITNEQSTLIPISFEENISTGFIAAMLKWDQMTIDKFSFPSQIKDKTERDVRSL